MGDHHKNPKANFHKNLPAQAVGPQYGCQIAPQKVLRTGIIGPLPEDQVRESTNLDGTPCLQVFGLAPVRDAMGNVQMGPNGLLTEANPTWHTPPLGWKVLRVGDPLTDDDFECAHMLLSVCVHRTLVRADGQPTMTVQPIGEMGPRVPWKEFVLSHTLGPKPTNGDDAQVK